MAGSSNMSIRRGTLSLVLRLSRPFGLAPLRLVPSREAYTVTVSYVLAIYGYLLLSIMQIFITVESFRVLWGLFTQKKLSLGNNNLSNILMWIIDTFTTVATSGVGCFGAVGRMQTMLKHMTSLENIRQKVHVQPAGLKKSRQHTFVIVFLLLNAIFFVTYCSFQMTCTSRDLSSDAVNQSNPFIRSLTVQCFKTPIKVIVDIVLEDISIGDIMYYWICYLLVLLQMQVSLIYLDVATALEAINIKMRSLAFISKSETGATWYSMREDIRCLTRSYVDVSCILDEKNRSDGALLFLIFIYLVVAIVLTGYICTNAIFLTNGSDRLFNIIIVAILYVLLGIAVVLYVEPFHQINEKTIDMQTLLSKIMYNFTPVGCDIPFELTIFDRLLVLNKLEISPLGVFVIKRSLIAKIYSLATTVLLFLVQIRLKEQETK